MPRSDTSSTSSRRSGSDALLVDFANEALIGHRRPDVFSSVQSRQLDRLGGQILIRNHGEKVANAVQPGALLVVRIHHVPGDLLQVGVSEHFVRGPRMRNPTCAGFKIHRAQFPALGRILQPLLEATLLLLVADGEPVLNQDDAGACQHALKLRTTVEEFEILGLRAEAHHVLDSGAVVPTAVEQDDFSGGGQMRRVALKVPLRSLALRRRGEGDYLADARIQALGDALDGAALAGCVAPLEEDDYLESLVANPLLKLDEFDLEPA